MRDLQAILTVHDRLDRLNADGRFDHAPKGGELRHLAAAMIWVYGTEGLRGAEWQTRAIQLAGIGSQEDPLTNIRLRALIAEDAPRYQAPNLREHGPCPGPTDPHKRCGNPKTVERFRITDPTTGEWRMVAYCRGHRNEAAEAFAAEIHLRETINIPEPAPNVGGLLPSHIHIAEWPDFYVWARPEWTPPALGICADDWPALQQVKNHGARPLRLLAGGEDPAPGSVPSLTVVGSGL